MTGAPGSGPGPYQHPPPPSGGQCEAWPGQGLLGGQLAVPLGSPTHAHFSAVTSMVSAGTAPSSTHSWTSFCSITHNIDE